eukprot:1147499-Karenia_brevis.AAC.1
MHVPQLYASLLLATVGSMFLLAPDHIWARVALDTVVLYDDHGNDGGDDNDDDDDDGDDDG